MPDKGKAPEMQVVGTKWACSNRLADDCPCEPPNGFKAIGQLLLSVGTPLNQSEQDVLYQLRNALLHSFGLYSESKNAVYRFFLTNSGAGALVTSHGLGRYFVDLLVLKNYFDSAVGEYKTALAATPDLQTKFALIFKNYGRIHVS